MASGPLDPDPVASLRAERDALARRCEQAEQRVRDLTAEVAALREQAAQRPTASDLSFFASDDAGAGLGRDGSDPRVVPLVLGAIAVVSAMVTLLALLNGTLDSPFGVVMIALTVGLAYAAARTRVPASQVTVTEGVVHAEKDGSTYRFDLRSDATRIEVVGEPGDAYWQVRFLRRAMDPLVVDAEMVDPHSFMAQLREHRPTL